MQIHLYKLQVLNWWIYLQLKLWNNISQYISLWFARDFELAEKAIL